MTMTDSSLIWSVQEMDTMYLTDSSYLLHTKSDDSAVTKYYTEDGKELKLNPGKTYVTVFESDNKAGVVWE